ncbi:MAG: DNA repair exonuclease [Acholeplasmatales bacterium]|nr:DNA repair exonuclease [Acholeplasmatales bacterium]
MKIIHTADIHLGSPLSSIEDIDKRTIRKNEILHSFERLVEYANRNDIKIIMMSGDVFDSNSPYKRDKEYFYHLIEKNPHINFLYLKGNHDISSKYDEKYPNLFLFKDTWTQYKFDNVVISGVELTSDNSKAIYPSLKLDKSNVNIVMMHGDILSKGANYISLKDLKNKNINYLALGHIHEKSLEKLDDSGYYAYSGCLEGRGFDEPLEKGFYVLNTENDKIDTQFIINSQRIIHTLDLDITKANSFGEVKDLISDLISDIKKEDIIRINLIGDNQIDEDLKDLVNYFSYFYFSIKDKTKRKINYNDFINDLSLKGEFVRKVLNDNDLTQEEKDEIIYIGLKALRGEVKL